MIENDVKAYFTIGVSRPESEAVFTPPRTTAISHQKAYVRNAPALNDRPSPRLTRSGSNLSDVDGALVGRPMDHTRRSRRDVVRSHSQPRRKIAQKKLSISTSA